MDGQAEVGYQQGEQETWGHWETQRRARMESRGPEDRFHSFKCVLGAKRSRPQLPSSSQVCPKQSVSEAFYFILYLLQLLLLLAVTNPSGGWRGVKKSSRRGKRQKKKKRG